MIKIFHLSTCSTCKQIIKHLNLPKHTIFQDIKFEPILKKDLKRMKNAIGSYEALFSKRAIKYKSMGLNKKIISEDEIETLILNEYTFLKRPVIFINDSVFVGNSKRVIEDAKKMIHE